MHSFDLDHTHYMTMQEMHDHHRHFMEMREMGAMSLDEFARGRLRDEFEEWLQTMGHPFRIRYIHRGEVNDLRTAITVEFDDDAPAVLFKLAWTG